MKNEKWIEAAEEIAKLAMGWQSTGTFLPDVREILHRHFGESAPEQKRCVICEHADPHTAPMIGEGRCGCTHAYCDCTDHTTADEATRIATYGIDDEPLLAPSVDTNAEKQYGAETCKTCHAVERLTPTPARYDHTPEQREAELCDCDCHMTLWLHPEPEPLEISAEEFLRDPQAALTTMRAGRDVIVEGGDGKARMVLSSKLIAEMQIDHPADAPQEPTCARCGNPKHPYDEDNKHPYTPAESSVLPSKSEYDRGRMDEMQGKPWNGTKEPR